MPVEPSRPTRSLFEVVADFERRKIIETLETVNRTHAAEKLGIPLSTLNEKSSA
jgi:DNA-binding NtrC family response regulator